MAAADKLSKQRSGTGTTLIGTFLFMGVLAVAFAIVGPVVQQGRLPALSSQHFEHFWMTIVVCCVTGATVSVFIGLRHYRGWWHVVPALVGGAFLGAAVGAALWSTPPLTPVITGCALIVVYSAVVHVRARPATLSEQMNDEQAQTDSHATEL
jgi:hypothetical protein